MDASGWLGLAAKAGCAWVAVVVVRRLSFIAAGISTKLSALSSFVFFRGNQRKAVVVVVVVLVVVRRQRDGISQNDVKGVEMMHCAATQIA